MPVIEVYKCEVCPRETRDRKEEGWIIKRRTFFNINDGHQTLVYCPDHAEKSKTDGDAMGTKLMDALTSKRK